MLKRTEEANKIGAEHIIKFVQMSIQDREAMLPETGLDHTLNKDRRQNLTYISVEAILHEKCLYTH